MLRSWLNFNKNELNQLRLVVGLGNPGERYRSSRHNVGFLAIEAFARSVNSPKFAEQKKFFSHTSEATRETVRLLLIKPQTFMNQSGRAVVAAKKYYKTNLSNILIIHDEIDLLFGDTRLSFGRGAAGHRGVLSVMSELGKNFTRLRVGIKPRMDTNPVIDTEDYVLQNFTKEEKVSLEETILPAVVEGIKNWIKKSSEL